MFRVRWHSVNTLLHFTPKQQWTRILFVLFCPLRYDRGFNINKCPIIRGTVKTWDKNSLYIVPWKHVLILQWFVEDRQMLLYLYCTYTCFTYTGRHQTESLFVILSRLYPHFAWLHSECDSGWRSFFDVVITEVNAYIPVCIYIYLERKLPLAYAKIPYTRCVVCEK